ncbi:hypothetical protein [Haloprofundus salinisoli]|uniref:hypothetical protein n=1 Tax=Haloprofundus salinisoli TaxID=2876193 RepID=UPI001CCA6758|nr:hypothetical protein [Haloprofundus salinisoli]
MSFSSTSSRSDRLSEHVESGLERAKSAASDTETPLTGTVDELFDVLVATEMLLESVDLARVPDVVDIEQLPGLVDFDRLADAIRERDPDLAVDLSNLTHVVDRRELWASVDLFGFAKAKRRLDRELEDLPGGDAAFAVESDSKAAADAEAFVSSLRSEAREVTIQQEVRKKITLARSALGEQHATLERLYASERTRSNDPSERRRGRNPTAVSLRPPGPLPDGVSTVPSSAWHSNVEQLPRLYGRRWRYIDAESGE